MLKICRFVRNLYLLNQKRVAEEQRQQAEGYSVTFEQQGPERFITYLEGDREINVIAEFSMFNDVILFTDSLVKWSVPYNEPLSEFDHLRVVNRMIRYFSCWGEVTLDNRPLPTSEELSWNCRKQEYLTRNCQGELFTTQLMLKTNENERVGSSIVELIPYFKEPNFGG